MTPSESAARLQHVVADVVPLLQHADAGRTIVSPTPGTWCAREVLGHLIDSACNNHRRFVLGHARETTQWDGYVQDHWVSSQHYTDEPWVDLVALWVAYNRHLAHVMAVTTPDVAAFEAVSPDGTRHVSVGWLMSDYVRHLEHHVAQIRALLAS